MRALAEPSAAAGLLIAVPAVASAASYVNESLGTQLALVVADTKAKGVPSFVSVGMFRVCYKSPGGLRALPTRYCQGD